MRQSELVKGAVTFLDVLGWKGIWGRENASASVEKLQILLQTAYETVSVATQRDGSPRGASTEVRSISDTIVVETTGERGALAIHAEVCQALIPKSIELGLPLRGATSYGAFLPKTSGADTIVIGPAVDEAASWHESTDWIGVILTPRACLLLDEHTVESQGWVEHQHIPFKRGRVNGLRCLDWTGAWDGDEETLRARFMRMGPLVTEIAPKYMNTLDFFRARSQKRATES